MKKSKTGNGISRRGFVAGLAAVPAAPLALGAVTQTAKAETADLASFMTVSKFVTKRDNLSETLGQRYMDGLNAAGPQTLANLPALAAAVAAGSLNADQQKQALGIQRAWYTGQVETDVVAYEEALMYQVVADVLYLRAYCPDRPGYWAAKPTNA